MEKEVLNLILVEVREMKGDMSEVKTRLTNIEGRLANVENDVSDMKGRLTNLENNMSQMKNDMVEVKGRLTNVEERLSNVEETSRFNKETVQSIMNVVTSHYMEFKKYIKSNDVQHNLYNAKILKYNKDN